MLHRLAMVFQRVENVAADARPSPWGFSRRSGLFAPCRLHRRLSVVSATTGLIRQIWPVRCSLTSTFYHRILDINCERPRCLRKRVSEAALPHHWIFQVESRCLPVWLCILDGLSVTSSNFFILPICFAEHGSLSSSAAHLQLLKKLRWHRGDILALSLTVNSTESSAVSYKHVSY